MVPMTPVVSTSIEAIGYDSAACELYVKFLNGSLYAIKNISKEVYIDFLIADSKGRYYNSVIKPQYPDVTKLD